MNLPFAIAPPVTFTSINVEANVTLPCTLYDLLVPALLPRTIPRLGSELLHFFWHLPKDAVEDLMRELSGFFDCITRGNHPHADLLLARQT